jgi:hypothetical protein
MKSHPFLDLDWKVRAELHSLVAFRDDEIGSYSLVNGKNKVLDFRSGASLHLYTVPLMVRRRKSNFRSKISIL